MNACSNILNLIEYASRSLSPSEFSDDLANKLYLQYSDKVSVEWPTPKTGYQWQLTSLGWVGYVPLSSELGISFQPKVPLANLFRMLEIAYDLDSFKLLEGLYDCESLKDFYEHLAAILASRLLDRARHGLYKTYKSEESELSFIRGRIDVLALSRKPIKTTIPCGYEEHTTDIPDNQIIAWTLHIILRSGMCSDRVFSIVRKAEQVLKHSVALTPFSQIDCDERDYNRLNSDYEVLHKLCRFFLENTGPTQNLGDRTMIPFLIDMERLFELFVARWLEQNIDKRYTVKAQQSLTTSLNKGAPRFTMDLIVYDSTTHKALCVLDTKYKAPDKVLNADYNQVVAYADALHCEHAFLIYPKKIEYPLNEKPGSIHVRSEVFDIGIDIDEAGKKLLAHLCPVLESANKCLYADSSHPSN